MKVSDLERHLSELGRMLELAGAKGNIISDLAAIGEGLGPFREYSLSDFARFLVRAEAFSRGEVPVIPPKKTSAPKTPKGPKASPPNTALLAQEAKRLYDHASEAAVTPEMVEEMVERVSKLGKEGMVEVALAIDLRFSGKGPPKVAIANQIKKRILDRKGSFQRAGLLDRETSGNHKSEAAVQ